MEPSEQQVETTKPGIAKGNSFFARGREDTYSYKGWLNSDFFLKRAFAIIGYSLAAQLIVWAVMSLLLLVLIIILMLAHLH